MWRLTAGWGRCSASAARGEPPKRTIARDERRWAGSRSTHRIVAATGRGVKEPITHAHRLHRTPRSLATPGAGMLRRVPDRFLMPLFVALWSSGYVVGAVALGAADPLPVLAV